MTNLRNGGRKLSQGQKKRLRIQKEQAIQQALLEQEQYDRQRAVDSPRGRPMLGVKAGLESPVIAARPATSHSWVVPGWRSGWRWFSNIALATIVAINTAPIPPELIQALPPHAQQQLTIGLAIVGIIGRFINQSRKKDKDDAYGI